MPLGFSSLPTSFCTSWVLPAHLSPRLPCPGLSHTTSGSWTGPAATPRFTRSSLDTESPSSQEDTREVIVR